MSTKTNRVFVARLLGLDVFDPLGDRLGRLRDAVVLDYGPAKPPLVVGLVVEVPGKKRVFVPMTRVTSINAGQVICTGLVNLRRFEQRGAETLVVAEMFDRRVTLADGSGDATVLDIGMEQSRDGDWYVSQLFVRRGYSTSPLRSLRRNETLIVDWQEAFQGARHEPQAAATFVASHEDLKPADFAEALHEMTQKRRLEVASELQDDRLADVLQELPDDDQVQILTSLDAERAAVVLEEMDPDDAADLLAELPEEQKEALLQLMEPDEAKDVRRLLEYEENTAGSMMTPVPVILPTGSHRGGGAGPCAPRGAHAGAGVCHLCLPAAAGNTHRKIPGRGPHPAVAALSAAGGAGQHRGLGFGTRAGPDRRQRRGPHLGHLQPERPGSGQQGRPVRRCRDRRRCA